MRRWMHVLMVGFLALLLSVDSASACRFLRSRSRPRACRPTQSQQVRFVRHCEPIACNPCTNSDGMISEVIVLNESTQCCVPADGSAHATIVASDGALDAPTSAESTPTVAAPRQIAEKPMPMPVFEPPVSTASAQEPALLSPKPESKPANLPLEELLKDESHESRPAEIRLPVERPVETPVAEPLEELIQKPLAEPAGVPDEKEAPPAEEPAAEVPEELPEESAEEPAVDPAEEAAEEPAVDPAEEAFEEPVEEEMPVEERPRAQPAPAPPEAPVEENLFDAEDDQTNQPPAATESKAAPVGVRAEPPVQAPVDAAEDLFREESDTPATRTGAPADAPEELPEDAPEEAVPESVQDGAALSSDPEAAVEEAEETGETVEPDEPETEDVPAESKEDDPFASVPKAPAEPMRRWIDNTGTHETVGTLIEVHADRIRILKQSGSYSTVPLTRLSREDQTYVAATGVRLASERHTVESQSITPPPTDAAGLTDTAGL